MPGTALNKQLETNIARRAQAVFVEQQTAVHVHTDIMFGFLLVIEWLAGIFVAMTISPLAWSGSQSSIHTHVWAALILGALIIVFPLYLVITRPGATITRHTVAVGQMLFSALLIHLTGGRIETHFHVFGSLAFLGFYRDWRVLITATIIVTCDHILRGIYFPQSVYGVNGIEPLRWLEHAGWVIFEDIFLILSCLHNVKEMHAIASRQAELEETRNKVEELVTIRTSALRASEKRLATQFAVTSNLAKASNLAEAAPKVIEAIVRGLLANNGTVAAILSTVDGRGAGSQPVCHWLYGTDKNLPPRPMRPAERARLTVCGLSEKVVQEGSVQRLRSLESGILVGGHEGDQMKKMGSAFAMPFFIDKQVRGVIEFFAEETIDLDEAELTMLESLGHQLGDFVLRMQAQSENLRLANLVEWSGEAIIGANTDGTITSWNRGAKKYFGYDKEDIKGQNLSLLFPEGKMPEQPEVENQEAGLLGEEGCECEAQRQDGKAFEVLLSRSPVMDGHKNVTGMSIMMHDITERKEADRRVSEFYSVVSHELRTPLTSVRGALGLIEGGVVEAGSEEALDLVKVARDSTDRLIRLINDMLDLKKIESGKMSLVCKPISAGRLVQKTLESLRGMAETASVKLVDDVQCNGQVIADLDRATQVLTNLVSNAIKFSQAKTSVVVSTSKTEDGMIRFSVTDNGPGISKSDQEKLFEKFQQLDSSDTRKQGGTGLGLAISKALVAQQKGRIGLESNPGQGSTFWFELPVAVSGPATDRSSSDTFEPKANKVEAPSQNGDASPNTAEHRNRILLVEDDTDLSRVLSTHFRHSGYDTTIAGCLSDARQSLKTEKFNVVVLDLTLPDGNGLDFLEEIKSNETTAMLPVIVITGQSIDDKVKENPHISDFFAKPFHSSALIEVLDRLTDEDDLHAVLLTNRDDRALNELGMQLKDLGVQFIERCKNLEAIAHNGQSRPSLVILDLSLPDSQAGPELKLLKYRRKSDTLTNLPAAAETTVMVTEGIEASHCNPDEPCHYDREKVQGELLDAVSALLNGICQ